MARILSIDYGKKRTGLAVSDPLQLIAGGLATVATYELWDYLQQYVVREQVERKDAVQAHLERCRGKLAVLLEQQRDLSTAIDQLLDDIAAGRKYMKTYRQMKMYNDPSTNPVLYKKK